jgi:hypothetical protein
MPSCTVGQEELHFDRSNQRGCHPKRVDTHSKGDKHRAVQEVDMCRC